MSSDLSRHGDDNEIDDVFPPALVSVLRPCYRLSWHGIHGWPHWVRVRVNGLRVAAASGADVAVVEAFALLHDIARRNEHFDPRHGARAAAIVGELDRRLLPLDEGQRELLRFACAHHTDGLVDAHVTIQTCWDADRLDLGRVGIRPRAKLLCTAAARHPDVIDWAWRRSRSR